MPDNRRWPRREAILPQNERNQCQRFLRRQRAGGVERHLRVNRRPQRSHGLTTISQKELVPGKRGTRTALKPYSVADRAFLREERLALRGLLDGIPVIAGHCTGYRMPCGRAARRCCIALGGGASGQNRQSCESEYGYPLCKHRSTAPIPAFALTS